MWQGQLEQVGRPSECGLWQELEYGVAGGRYGRPRAPRGSGPSGQQGGTRLPQNIY